MNLTDDIARRMALLHAAGYRADEHTRAVDVALQPATDAEHVRRLTGSLGRVACADTGEDLADALVDHLADTLAWAEQLAREEAAA